MADISITVNTTTPIEDRTIAWKLAQANEGNSSPFADVEEMLEAMINRNLVSWGCQERQCFLEKNEIIKRLESATCEQRAAVILELPALELTEASIGASEIETPLP